VGKPTKTPKDGAQRKREFDKRQRELGRKPLQFWLDENEAKAVREFLRNFRET